MPQSQANILIHIVFSTKNRFPFLKEQYVLNRLYPYVAAVCKGCDSPALEVGGIADHIHLLVSLGRYRSVAEIAREVKANSSAWVKTLGGMLSKLSWQGGYGAFSLHLSQVEIVRGYIRNQVEHHRVRSFQEEYIALLNEYGVAFDEKYIWK